MSFERKTSLPDSWGITAEMMENPCCRIPFLAPDNIPDDLKKDLAPLYQQSRENIGTVPRFVQMLGHSPALVEAWALIESRVRFAYLQTDPAFLKTLQLVIIKTAILNHSNNCTAHNVDLGLAVGLTWDQMAGEDAWVPTAHAPTAWRAVLTGKPYR